MYIYFGHFLAGQNLKLGHLAAAKWPNGQRSTPAKWPMANTANRIQIGSDQIQMDSDQFWIRSVSVLDQIRSDFYNFRSDRI